MLPASEPPRTARRSGKWRAATVFTITGIVNTATAVSAVTTASATNIRRATASAAKRSHAAGSAAPDANHVESAVVTGCQAATAMAIQTIAAINNGSVARAMMRAVKRIGSARRSARMMAINATDCERF